MATLSQFLDITRGRLPGCPEKLLEDGILAASIEFCQRTELLVESVAIDVVAGEAVADVYPDSELAWEILSLRRGLNDLVPLDRSVFITERLAIKEGLPQYFYLEGDGQLVLGPIPTDNETLQAIVTLRPKDTATRIPDVLFREYRYVLAAGARAWVRRHHGDWSESRLEAEDRALFERAITNQNIRRARGGVNTPLRVKTQKF